MKSGMKRMTNDERRLNAQMTKLRGRSCFVILDFVIRHSSFLGGGCLRLVKDEVDVRFDARSIAI
jgi:hypothetical protein